MRGSGSGCGCRSIALGLAIHLVRDLAETGSGVAALWPLSDHSFSLAYGVYLTVMAATVGVVAGRCVDARRAVAISSPGEAGPLACQRPIEDMSA